MSVAFSKLSARQFSSHQNESLVLANSAGSPALPETMIAHSAVTEVTTVLFPAVYVSFDNAIYTMM